MNKYMLVSMMVVLLTACAPRASAGMLIVKTPPPVVKVEVRPRAPFKKAVWIPGHWKWTGRKFVWVKGHWVKARRGFVYIPGHWKKVNTGWVWIDGHWRKS